jgi:hypothetical protein
MGVLGAVAYDPASSVSKSTASLLAMTAIDTTNLRITFTAPSNGAVLVRMKGTIHGASFGALALLGILDGSTVKARMAPSGSEIGADTASQRWGQEVSFVVSGLTPYQSYTWDAAYGVEQATASTGLKYGGPNNATTDDAFGAFHFEIWDTANLLAGKLYDPASAVTKATDSLLAMTALDTTNLRHTFTCPASGKVLWRIKTLQNGGGGVGQHLLGILESATVQARSSPSKCKACALTDGNSYYIQEASGVISNLTAGNSYTFDAAYGVEIIASGGSGLKYGGPDNATGNDAFGGIAYEIWAA